jgi:hypothetical protein
MSIFALILFTLYHKRIMMLLMKPEVRVYLSGIGRRGGRKSRRTLDPQMARTMVLIREARRAFRRFRVECFWSCDPSYRITAKDVPWVADELMKHGRREAWRVGARLCR